MTKSRRPVSLVVGARLRPQRAAVAVVWPRAHCADRPNAIASQCSAHGNPRRRLRHRRIRGAHRRGSASRQHLWSRPRRRHAHRRKRRWHSLRDQALPVQGDSERLPFQDGAFDIVTCANSFHHYPHQDRAVAEMHRVLKPGGRLLLLDGCRDNLWGWFIYDLCVAAVEGDVRHASARDLRRLFHGTGFTSIVQNVYHGPAPFLLTEGVAGSGANTGFRRRGSVSASNRTGVMAK